MVWGCPLIVLDSPLKILYFSVAELQAGNRGIGDSIWLETRQNRRLIVLLNFDGIIIDRIKN
jgi:hypothetical protein